MEENIFTVSGTAKKSKNRAGRGISAGRGKTAGRGTKGQKSRAGHNIPKQFEGGQSNLSLRLPKLKGFKSHNKNCKEISLTEISKFFKSGDIITPESLIKSGLVKIGEKAKILANGDINILVSVKGVSISRKALDLISQAKLENKNEETKSTDKK